MPADNCQNNDMDRGGAGDCRVNEVRTSIVVLLIYGQLIQGSRDKQMPLKFVGTFLFGSFVSCLQMCFKARSSRYENKRKIHRVKQMSQNLVLTGIC